MLLHLSGVFTFTLLVTIVYDNVNYETKDEEEIEGDDGGYLEFSG